MPLKVWSLSGMCSPLRDYTKFHCGCVQNPSSLCHTCLQASHTCLQAKLLKVQHRHACTAGVRFTVPILWDKKNRTIVNNESSELLRILNSGFNNVAKNPDLDLYPEDLRSQIDEVNSWVYTDINNGVYKYDLPSPLPCFQLARLACLSCSITMTFWCWHARVVGLVAKFLGCIVSTDW